MITERHDTPRRRAVAALRRCFKSDWSLLHGLDCPDVSWSQYNERRFMMNRNHLATCLHFFWAGLVKQRQTGGIVPSQRFLIAKMIAPVPKGYRGRVIELGAGNGALTLQLAARCPEAQILTCEINPTLARDVLGTLMAEGLSRRVEVFTGAAEKLLAETGPDGAAKPDFVISGIPLGNLGGAKAIALIDAIHQALGKGGTYIQFQHSLLDRKKIKTRFPILRTVPVFLNFPPAVVYYACRNCE